MKIKLLISLIVFCLLSSCSKNRHIPDISILEEIPSEKLADALKAEENKDLIHGKFEDIYPGIRRQLETMTEIDKAKVAHLTYRELIDAMDIVMDTIAEKKFSDEWQATYDKYLPQAEKLAKDMSFSLDVEIRTATTRAYMYGYTARYSDCARNSSLYKYMNRVPYSSMDVDGCWDYVEIIKDKIDNNFASKRTYCCNKQLELIKDDHPEAFYFLSIHQAKVNEAYEAMERLLK
jgi:hypothetical protein